MTGCHAHREQSETTKSPVPGSQTHLVVSGQPTGWTAMAHAVRNFDEEKVKDCKEDVDTLLVFVSYSVYAQIAMIMFRSTFLRRLVSFQPS